MKKLVVFERNNSAFDKGFKEFPEDQSEEMRHFIDKKVMSGMTCHVYEHRESFELNKTVQSTSKPLTKTTKKA